MYNNLVITLITTHSFVSCAYNSPSLPGSISVKQLHISVIVSRQCLEQMFEPFTQLLGQAV